MAREHSSTNYGSSLWRTYRLGGPAAVFRRCSFLADVLLLSTLLNWSKCLSWPMRLRPLLGSPLASLFISDTESGAPSEGQQHIARRLGRLICSFGLHCVSCTSKRRLKSRKGLHSTSPPGVSVVNFSFKIWVAWLRLKVRCLDHWHCFWPLEQIWWCSCWCEVILNAPAISCRTSYCRICYAIS